MVAGQERNRVPLVSELMSRDLVTIDSDKNVFHAWELMRIQRIRHLPVTDDDGVLLGLITQRDLIDIMAAEKGARRRRIEAAMQKEVNTIAPASCAGVAARFMLETKMGCLPVVDDSGVLVGILTESDFVMQFARDCTDD